MAGSSDLEHERNTIVHNIISLENQFNRGRVASKDEYLRQRQELEQRLRAKGCIRCYLLVTKDNHSALRFYEEQAWEPMDLHIYGKDL